MLRRKDYSQKVMALKLKVTMRALSPENLENPVIGTVRKKAIQRKNQRVVKLTVREKWQTAD